MDRELTRSQQLLGTHAITILLMLLCIFVWSPVLLLQIGWCITIYKMKAGLVVQFIWTYLFKAYEWIKEKIEEM